MTTSSLKRAENFSQNFYSSDWQDDHYDDCDPEEICDCDNRRQEMQAVAQASSLDIDY